MPDVSISRIILIVLKFSEGPHKGTCCNWLLRAVISRLSLKSLILKFI